MTTPKPFTAEPDYRALMKPGDRVKLTHLAIKQGLEGPHNRTAGRIISINKLNGFIRVLRDGTKTPYLYHPVFWEKE